MSDFESALRRYEEALRVYAVALQDRDAARNRLLKMHQDLLGCITTPLRND